VLISVPLINRKTAAYDHYIL